MGADEGMGELGVGELEDVGVQVHKEDTSGEGGWGGRREEI